MSGKRRTAEAEYEPCSVCHSDALVEDRKSGDLICTTCGIVCVSRIVDPTAEYRIFSDSDKDPSRVGVVDEMYDNSLGTSVAAPGFGQATDLNRGLLNYTSNSSTTHDKNLREATGKIDDLCARLTLPEIMVQNAKQIYSDFEKKRNGRRVKKDALVCAVVHLACQRSGFSRTVKEIANMAANVDEKVIKRTARAVKELLREDGDIDQSITSPTALIERFCNYMKLDFQYSKFSKEICDKAKDMLEGKQPASIAAASIFLLLQHTKEKRSLNDVSQACSVASNTVRSHFMTLSQSASHLISEDFWKSKIAVLQP